MSPTSLIHITRSCALTAGALACAGVASSPAPARGGGGGRPEVRVAGTCGKGASSSLKVKARDGGLETEFEVHGRPGATWRVTIVHERQVAWRGSRRMGGPSRSFGVVYRLPDFSGADLVSARAVGPRGVVCSASATLPG